MHDWLSDGDQMNLSIWLYLCPPKDESIGRGEGSSQLKYQPKYLKFFWCFSSVSLSFIEWHGRRQNIEIEMDELKEFFYRDRVEGGWKEKKAK